MARMKAASHLARWLVSPTPVAPLPHIPGPVPTSSYWSSPGLAQWAGHLQPNQVLLRWNQSCLVQGPEPWVRDHGSTQSQCPEATGVRAKMGPIAWTQATS